MRRKRKKVDVSYEKLCSKNNKTSDAISDTVPISYARMDKKADTKKTARTLIHPYIVLSLGGSLVIPPAGIDVRFVKHFHALLRRYIRRGWRFVIICGGGTLARQYQEALRESGVADGTLLDWIGIHACRMNAQYVRMIFGKDAREGIIMTPTHVRRADFGHAHVLVGGGEKPGQTSDHVAVQCAINVKATTLINLSNIDSIYDRDPKKKGARPLSRLAWRTFKTLFPAHHSPGAHVPFDPVATRLASRHGMTVCFLDGRDFKALDAALRGLAFRGTIVS